MLSLPAGKAAYSCGSWKCTNYVGSKSYSATPYFFPTDIPVFQACTIRNLESGAGPELELWYGMWMFQALTGLPWERPLWFLILLKFYLSIWEHEQEGETDGYLAVHSPIAQHSGVCARWEPGNSLSREGQKHKHLGHDLLLPRLTSRKLNRKQR